MKKNITSAIVALFAILFMTGCGIDLDVVRGDLTFFANDSAGNSGGIISIIIEDIDTQDTVEEGELTQSSTGQGIDCDTPSSESVFSTSLPEGQYIIRAFERDFDGVDGGVFTPLDGQTFEVRGETCYRIELGVDEGFDNARLAGGVRPMMIKNVTIMSTSK
ncbi:hypothetical protein [Algivirga pacifica]|uniref:DUF4382 domain-containing protein n=1 Tax=Algivirga pacifica TaxID=1162670 RepID=A0ABP9CVX3_9BACT